MRISLRSCIHLVTPLDLYFPVSNRLLTFLYLVFCVPPQLDLQRLPCHARVCLVASLFLFVLVDSRVMSWSIIIFRSVVVEDLRILDCDGWLSLGSGAMIQSSSRHIKSAKQTVLLPKNVR